MKMGATYEVTWLSRLLHSFPHLDLTFKTINSTFNPHSAHYREVSVVTVKKLRCCKWVMFCRNQVSDSEIMNLMKSFGVTKGRI